jgi:hypothetical protein
MKSKFPSTESMRKRATNELKEFAVVAAYLCLCFTAILYLKASILKAEGIAFAPFGFAVIKALICAKFVSLGHVLPRGGAIQVATSNLADALQVGRLSRSAARVKRP